MSTVKFDRLSILGLGHYFPPKTESSRELIRRLGFDEKEQLGLAALAIDSRHRAGEETTSQLCANAAEAALKDASLEPKNLAYIIAHSATPDVLMPSLANEVQGLLKGPPVPAVPINAACSGFNYGVDIASGLSRRYSPILLTMGESFIPYVGEDTRSDLRFLAGDGAAALVLGPERDDKPVIIDNYVNSRNSKVISLKVRNDSGSMDGKGVSGLARVCAIEATNAILERTGLKVTDFRYVIPHQANRKLVGAVMYSLDVPEENVFYHIQKRGNTGGVSPLACLSELKEEKDPEKALKPGDKLLVATFGAGFSYGACVIEWR